MISKVNADAVIRDVKLRAEKNKAEATLRQARKTHPGWIAVDLDGTLAHYETWVKWNTFGKPIGPMLDRVKQWLHDGEEVRIFTARVGVDPSEENVCYKSGEVFTNEQMADAIKDWTEQHLGRRLTVTCVKDLHMKEVWDDRAVGVEANTGRTLVEAHLAELNALEGKP